MIKRLTSKKNLNDAYERVYRNEGSAGLDGVHITELKSILQSQGKRYIEQIERETFQVSPILGVEIPKSNGKKRLLGIPTVVDRVLQQALHQVLQPIFEPDFQQHSYGFRPQRNAHQAIAQSLEHIITGCKDIVDMDLKSFFDEVEHYILLELIYKKVKCKPTMKLLRCFLKAPILTGGKLNKRKKGVPQGSPLSPLLSNILLNELDKELEKRGHRYVRYADDFSVYVNSKKSAKRVGNSIFKFLRDKLQLSINREKSGMRKPLSFQLPQTPWQEREEHYHKGGQETAWQDTGGNKDGDPICDRGIGINEGQQPDNKAHNEVFKACTTKQRGWPKELGSHFYSKWPGLL